MALAAAFARSRDTRPTNASVARPSTVEPDSTSFVCARSSRTFVDRNTVAFVASITLTTACN